jgi:hypothetical protein
MYLNAYDEDSQTGLSWEAYNGTVKYIDGKKSVLHVEYWSFFFSKAAYLNM